MVPDNPRENSSVSELYKHPVISYLANENEFGKSIERVESLKVSILEITDASGLKSKGCIQGFSKQSGGAQV